MMMTHPEFIDVRMEVLRRTSYHNSKGVLWWSMKVIWWNKRGWTMTDATRIKMTDTKWKEFTLT